NDLHVDSFPVSFSYLDPISGVKIYRVTNMDWPVLMHMGNWGHDYAEAGNEVSLPYNGSTRAIHVYDWGTGPPGPNGQDLHYLIDFTPGGGFSNARPLTGSLAPRIDIAFTFSSNPATPYYAYVATNSGIR